MQFDSPYLKRSRVADAPAVDSRQTKTKPEKFCFDVQIKPKPETAFPQRSSGAVKVLFYLETRFQPLGKSGPTRQDGRI